MHNFTLKHIIAGTIAGGKAPDSFVLFKAGWNELEDGLRYFVDKESYDLISAYWHKRGLDIVIDYEHQTLSGGQAPAAGWINPELVWDPQRGIIASVKWTDQACRQITANEYRYFSQVFQIRKADSKLVMLYSVALTNNPRTNNLEALAAKSDIINQRGDLARFTIIDELTTHVATVMGNTIEDVLNYGISPEDPERLSYDGLYGGGFGSDEDKINWLLGQPQKGGMNENS